MALANRAQIDPRGVSAVVAVIVFLALVVALTMIDSGISLLTGLVGVTSRTSPTVLVLAFVVAIVGAAVGYLFTRVAVGLA